jgi:hypothetical protein
MSFQGDHPFPGQPHPWTDPLAPPDLMNPRPDWALGMAAGLAPSPEDFPMDEMGKRDYYAAVESSVQQMMAMQHHAMERHLAERRAVSYSASASQRAKSVDLLLLMP